MGWCILNIPENPFIIIALKVHFGPKWFLKKIALNKILDLNRCSFYFISLWKRLLAVYFTLRIRYS